LVAALATAGCGGASAGPNPPLPGAGGAGGIGSAPGAGAPKTGVSPGTDAGIDTGRRIVGDGSSGPGFSELYATIFLPSCSGGDCHNPGSRGGINVMNEMNAFNTLIQFVTPGNAAGSNLYRILLSGEMPRGGPPLSSTELADIAAWIERGAPND
jgi:hypothetical protein